MGRQPKWLHDLMLSLLPLLLACASDPQPGIPAESQPGADGGSTVGSAEKPLTAQAPLSADAPIRIAARHILVAYQGALGADPQLRRTRGEALTRARATLDQLQGGVDFAHMATEISDGPSAAQGGNLFSFPQGTMDPSFERAAFRLAEGAISELVETPFGYHIIKREPLEEIHVFHVLVQWIGLTRTGTDRSHEEAQIIANEALVRLRAGEDVAKVAADLSDGPTALRGGDLGWFQRGQMVPAFDDGAFALEVGEVSPIIESPLGLHVIVRVE